VQTLDSTNINGMVTSSRLPVGKLIHYDQRRDDHRRAQAGRLAAISGVVSPVAAG
jgi:hypothetical protein